MIVGSIKDFPDVLEVAEVAQGAIDNIFLSNLRKADYCFLSDSRDSFATLYHLQDGKYHMHLTSKRGKGRDLSVFLTEVLSFMLRSGKARVVLGFVKHKGLKLLLAHRLKDSGAVRTIDLPEGERMYCITKDDIKEIERCLEHYR